MSQQSLFDKPPPRRDLETVLRELGIDHREGPKANNREILKDGVVVFVGTALETWEWIDEGGAKLL